MTEINKLALLEFGQFLFKADSFDCDDYQENDWGISQLMPALRLALDVAATL